MKKNKVALEISKHARETDLRLQLTVSQDETKSEFGFVGANRTADTESKGGEESSYSVVFQ